MKSIILTLLILLSFGEEVQARNFDKRLIVKLSQIMEVPPPRKIVIKRLTQKKITENHEKWMRGPCIANNYAVLGYCRDNPPLSTTFLYGRWIPEKDPSFLHIELHKNSGMDTLIHEFFHWYYGNKNPEENNDFNAERMMILIIESQEFKRWLEEEEK